MSETRLFFRRERSGQWFRWTARPVRCIDDMDFSPLQKEYDNLCNLCFMSERHTTAAHRLHMSIANSMITVARITKDLQRKQQKRRKRQK